MIRRLRMTVAALHQRMSKRFTRLGRRIDGRFKATEARMDARFKATEAGIDARFKITEARFDVRFDTMERQLRELVRSVDLLTDRLNQKTRALDEGVDHCKRVLHEHEKRIRDVASPPI